MSEKAEWKLVTQDGKTVWGMATRWKGNWCSEGLILPGVVDHADPPSWPDLVAAPGAAARLADAQARLDKAQARILELEAEMDRWRREADESLRRGVLRLGEAEIARKQRDEERENAKIASIIIENMKRRIDQLEARDDHVEKERDQAMARAERAEKERDEAVEWRREVAEALDVIKNNGVIADVDYAVRHARALRHVADQRHDAMARADQAIRDRDEIGCQLEALRAVQRDDLQVIVARIALVEADVAGMKVDPRDAKEARERWQAAIDEKGGE